jgi:very-long-chain (3R)-3-hydroxyacyl-CoA dehydratase
MASEAQPRSEKGTGKATLSSFAHLYLVLYNVSLCVGWFLVLLVTARYLTAEGGFGWRCPGLYAQVKTFLLVSQSAAVLEVLHAAIGIVKSNVMLTLFQVISRQFVLWGCIVGVPGVSTHVGVVLVLVAWSVTEIIRYAYYAASLLGTSVYLLTWCRYTFSLFFIQLECWEN